METVGFYLMLFFVVAVGAWQAVCVAVWIWGKVRRPEEVEKKREEVPEAVRKGLERITRESVGENGKSA